MKVALVTGVGRREGLGFEVCRQLEERGFVVVRTARTGVLGGIAMDVSSDASVLAVADMVRARWGRLDVLVNNASRAFDVQTRTLDVTIDAAKQALDVDLFGAWRTLRAFAPLLRECVVNVSSGAGSFGDPRGLTNLDVPWADTLASYSVAKAALNALTCKMAAALRPVRVNAVNPGHVATDVEAAARSVVWAATLPPGGPTGRYFSDGKPAPW